MTKQSRKSKLDLSKKIVFEINRNTLLVLAISFALILTAYGVGKASNQSSTKTSPSPIYSTIPSTIPFPTPSPSPKIQFTAPKAVPAPSPSIDPNTEIIRCIISPNCGGGFKEMTREQCKDTVCCQVSLNEYKYELRSQSACNQQQSSSIYKNCVYDCELIYDSKNCEGLIETGTECRMNQLNKKMECIRNCSK